MDEAMLSLAHLGYGDPVAFTLYFGQVALSAGFIFYCLRIIVARRAPEHGRQDVDDQHERAAQPLVTDV